MASLTVVLDCADLDAQATFWTEALRYRRTGNIEQYIALSAPEGSTGPKLILQQVPEAKTVKNRVHLDIDIDPSEDLDAEVRRLVALGATTQADGDVQEFGMHWIRMIDPEGNEFCVCRG